jgi:short-subunit dehydrogenase
MIASQRRLAVVTGAAGGLGLAFANQLAARGYRLLLVDRRQAQLEQVCAAIADRYEVSVDSYAADLCNRHEVQQLAQHLEQLDVDLLVNNAGFGTVDYFVDCDPSFLAGIADIHVIAPTLLTRAVLPGMVDRNRGNIINVSSLGAWLHSAGNVQYGATKSFLAVFSESLQQELRGTGVRIQALCPGFVRTDFHASEEMKAFHQCTPAANMWMSPDFVVAYSLRKMSRRQVIVIPGLRFRILGRLARMPFLQPIMQFFTRVPRMIRRAAPQPAVEPVVEPRNETVLRIVKRA